MSAQAPLVLGILAASLYGIVRRVAGTEPTPDPWDAEVEKATHEVQAVELCHRCLTPQEQPSWFCPACGASIGAYNNYMPFVYLFAQGEVLRVGVTDHIRPSALVVCGFVLYSIVSYLIFAPVYWYFLFRNLRKSRETMSGAKTHQA